jgi:hypothetical protein
MDLLLSSREAKAFGRTLGSTPALMPISKLYSDPARSASANAGAVPNPNLRDPIPGNTTTSAWA